MTYDALMNNPNASTELKNKYKKEKEVIQKSFLNCSQNMELFNQGVLCYLLSG